MLDYTIQCFLVTLLSSGTSLVVQWLRILNSSVKGRRSDP